MNNNTINCCKSMDYAINKKLLEYDNIFREYIIDVSEIEAMRLYFCPWCGIKFGKKLAKEYFEELYKSYGISLEEADLDNFTNIPQEFKTDEWWKKRGL